jgi:DNA polymerase III sliding clamp (beta) subunit (PCNA family)
MKFTVSRNELMAALLFASDDENRYTLQGVLVETHHKNKPKLVSTDGRRLAVIETVADQPEMTEAISASFLFSAAFIKPLCGLSKAIGGKLFPWIEFDCQLGEKPVSVLFVGSQCTVTVRDNALIEGGFPNWQKVLPAKNAPRKPINDLGINADFMADFSKAAKMLEATSPVLQMNLIGKNEAIEVRMSMVPNFYGLIMPCKTDETLQYQPEFVSIVTGLPIKAEAPETETDEN